MANPTRFPPNLNCKRRTDTKTAKSTSLPEPGTWNRSSHARFQGLSGGEKGNGTSGLPVGKSRKPQFQRDTSNLRLEKPRPDAGKQSQPACAFCLYVAPRGVLPMQKCHWQQEAVKTRIDIEKSQSTRSSSASTKLFPSQPPIRKPLILPAMCCVRISAGVPGHGNLT